MISQKDDSVSSLHRDCFACGIGVESLRLKFALEDNGSVSIEWHCGKEYQGYPGIIHGGIIATVLDAAMTNCLLLRGIPALTADLHVKYCLPARIGLKTVVKASISRARPPLYILRSELFQEGEICAKAEAKFMRNDNLNQSCDV